MKLTRIAVTTLSAALSFAHAVHAHGQSAMGASVQAGVITSTNADPQASAQVNTEVSDRYLTSVQTELTGKVDTRSAVVGQEVTAKTRASVKLADGTTLPKGTELVGHVTQVQAHGKDQPYATLAMSFDHAELKGGRSVALRVVIRAVAPQERSTTAPMSGLAADEGAAPVGAPGGSTSASSRGGSGLGGRGGLAGAPVHSTGQAAGGTGDLAGSAMQLPGGAVTSAGESVSAAPRATGLAGVMLSNSASTSGSANVSGTLSSAGKNISLDSGTEITMGVILR